MKPYMLKIVEQCLLVYLDTLQNVLMTALGNHQQIVTKNGAIQIKQRNEVA